jgi:multiple sugar transport system permease protein
MSAAAAPAPARAVTSSSGRGPSRKSGPGRIVAFVILILMAIAWLLPFLWAVDTALKTEEDAASENPSWIPPNGFTLDSFRDVLEVGNVPIWMWNSLLTSVLITAITVAISALAAYAFSRIDFRGRRWLYGVVIASIIVPGQVLIIPLYYEMLALRLVDTYWGLILPQVIAPAMVFILKLFFDQIPQELDDAARIDGAGRGRIFWSVALPLSRPILAAVSIFVFIGAFNNFLWPFLIISDTALMTLPVGLQTVISAYGIVYSQVMAQAVLAALPLVVLFLVFQRQVIKGFVTSGFGGQ